MLNKLDIDQLNLSEGHSIIGNINNNKEILFTPITYRNYNILSTTSTTLQSNISKISQILKSGLYKVYIQGLFSTSNANRDVIIDLKIDNISIFNNTYFSSTNNKYYSFSFELGIEFNVDSTHTFLLSYSRGTTNTTAIIKNTMIKISQEG